MDDFELVAVQLVGTGDAAAKAALLTQSLTTIDAIEALTGFDLLSSRRVNTGRSEAAIERAQAAQMWER